jgi:hypothetical protein
LQWDIGKTLKKKKKKKKKNKKKNKETGERKKERKEKKRKEKAMQKTWKGKQKTRHIPVFGQSRVDRMGQWTADCISKQNFSEEAHNFFFFFW